jgi:predicted membrane-bound dolichyl-phosphate-mannose-protein mannosyltransferase
MNSVDEKQRFTSRFRSFLGWFTVRENIAVCVIAAIMLVLHLLIIAKPAAMVFDERIYVPEAKSFISGSGLAITEHPPLGKWLIAGGICVFGDNPTGWRMPSVISGAASIILFYLICVQLVRKEDTEDEAVTRASGELPQKNSWFTMKIFVPVFAAFLFAFENLSFIQANVAMLDVFSVTFMLLGFLLYLRNKYLWCGVVMGLGMLCKATVFLAILAILVHWAFTRRHEIAAAIRTGLKRREGESRAAQLKPITDMVKLLLAAGIVWIVLLPVLEYPATHQLANPISRTLEMLKFHINITTGSYDSPIASAPWTWLSSPTNIIYWPDSTLFTIVSGHWGLGIDSANPLYYLSVSWNIWTLIILSILFTVYEIIRNRTVLHSVAAFVLSWFFGVYVLLIPLELVTGRLMFTYYFYPAVPAVCLAIAWSAWKIRTQMNREKKRRVIFLCMLAGYSAAAVVIFFFMSPFGGHFLFGS